ncbi:MAG: MaoC family dehydratase [Deltaproteobacteria bacterium]|nr:MaoC family dehydratase [Deltaproteobacteria bacterium]
MGQAVEKTTIVTAELIEAFALATGDLNPVHLDEAYAARSFFRRRVAHGLLPASLAAALLGTELPGPGTIYLSQSLEFQNPVFPGDAITARVEVCEKVDESRKLKMRTTAVKQDGRPVLDGWAWVLAR